MAEARPMTMLELIRLIGDVIVEVDVLRSTLDRSTWERKRLDNIRDELDTYQRRLVRNVINTQTARFRELTASLKGVSAGLQQTIEEVDRIAQTLESLVKVVGIVQKIAELAP